MIIQTKANVEDEIFYLDKNKICSAKVVGIKIYIIDEKTPKQIHGISEDIFGINYVTVHGHFKEDQIFLSPDEVTENLLLEYKIESAELDEDEDEDEDDFWPEDFEHKDE
jgi:hypothetical protein